VIPDSGLIRRLQWAALGAKRAKILSTSTLHRLHENLNRSVKRAMARDKVRRNVVDLCGVPKGLPGRPSKSLTLDRARAALDAAEPAPLHAYVVVSLLVGARTEELRALQWSHVDLEGKPTADPPVMPSIQVWRSVREGWGHEDERSRRTLALSIRAIDALRGHHEAQERRRAACKPGWNPDGLVFVSEAGTALDAANVRRGLPAHRQGRRPRRDGLDAARATAQLRVVAL